MTLDLRTKEYTKKYHPSDRICCRVECFCACTGLLFFLPLVSVPDSRYGRYWANQGLLILLIELMGLLLWGIVSWLFGFLAMIPFIGILFTVIKVLIGISILLAVLFFPVRAMVCVYQKRAVDIPFIGHFRIIIK